MDDLLKSLSQLTPVLIEASETWADWPRDLLSSLFPWPAIAAVLLLYLLMWKGAPKRLAEIFKPFRSVKLFGAEFVLGEQEAREVAKNAKEAFEGYRKQAQTEYDRLSRVYGLREKLKGVVHSLGDVGKTPDFRCTIHVPYILFTDTLYQLLDYYPKGRGRARIRSVRFGIMGRAWRLGESETEGRVPTCPRALIRGWGMTGEEADDAGSRRQSFTSVVLKDEQESAVGIFYMDSSCEDAFGGDEGTLEQLHRTIADESNRRGLTDAIGKLNDELRRLGPFIRIYE